MENFMFLIGAIITFFFLHYQELSWFYKIELKYCDKFKGHCELCNCWSCKRKDYIDEYKNIISNDYKNFGGKNG